MDDSDTEFTSPDEMSHWAAVVGSSEELVVDVNVRDTHDLEIGEPDWGLESRADLPMGEDRAPAPADYLVVGIVGCQVEVVRQCLEKARVEEYTIRGYAEDDVADPGDPPAAMPDHVSARIQRISVEIEVTTTDEFEDRVRRCVDVAEDACICGRSVEAGIDVPVDKSVRITTR